MPANINQKPLTTKPFDNYLQEQTIESVILWFDTDVSAHKLESVPRHRIDGKLKGNAHPAARMIKKIKKL